jgi:hypothetical protein
MKQIVFYSDILRPYNYILTEMIPLIKHLTSYQLTSLGYKVTTIVELGFTIEDFFFLNKNIPSIEAYHTLDEIQKVKLWTSLKNNITNEASEYLASFFKGSIAIGYHSSQEINNILNKHNITYLDFFESAYRYLDDTYFSIQTNNKDIKTNLLNNYALNKDKLYIQANYLKSLSVRSKSDINIKPKSALIVCQTALDIVLIKSDSTIDSLLNYQDEIKQLSSQYDVIYYKLHPWSDILHTSKLKEFFSSIYNSQEINYDIYELFSNDNLELVAGINSGALYEAEFFNKKSMFFGKKYHHYHINNEPNQNFYTLLNSNKYIFDIIFWDNILHNKNTPLSQIDIFDNYKDLIRNAIRVSSSYSMSPYLELKKFNTQVKNVNNKLENLDNKTEGLDHKVENLDHKVENLDHKVENLIIKTHILKRIKKIYKSLVNKLYKHY